MTMPDLSCHLAQTLCIFLNFGGLLTWTKVLFDNPMSISVLTGLRCKTRLKMSLVSIFTKRTLLVILHEDEEV